MSQDLTNVEENKALAKQAADLSEWGDPNIGAQDIEIPMLLMQQYMSDKVKNQQAKFGEIRDSSQNKLIAEEGQPVELIPFHIEKYWVEYTVDSSGKNKKFKDRYQVTPQNADQARMEPGLERDYVIEVYALLADNTDDIPYALPLRRTSLRAGKVIATQMYVNNRNAGKNPAAYTINVKTAKKAGDNGEYAVAEVSVGRETTPEEQGKCLDWLRTIKAGGAKTDATHLEGEVQDSSVGENQREY